MMTVREILQYGKHALEDSRNEYAKYESRVLLEEVLGIKYMQMLVNPDASVSSEAENRYKEMLEKRRQHYPLQYILGYAHFMDYTFIVNEHVLIPRNDTEVLVETVDQLLNSKAFESRSVSLLDLCCGSGCIGISLKLYHDNVNLALCDISKDALEVASRNLKKYQLDAALLESDLFTNVKEQYSIIVCNPPYIERDVIPTLMPEVKDYEPMQALDGGVSGLDFYQAILADVHQYLNREGYLFFEIGYNQGQAVSGLMKNAGFCDVCVKKDYAGLDRIVYGHL